MDPVDHSSHNFTFKGPEPDIGDLRVFRGQDTMGRPVIVSHWKPNDLELQALIAGGSVRLGIHGEIMPPVSVGVDQP